MVWKLELQFGSFSFRVKLVSECVHPKDFMEDFLYILTNKNNDIIKIMNMIQPKQRKIFLIMAQKDKLRLQGSTEKLKTTESKFLKRGISEVLYEVPSLSFFFQDG